MSNNETAEHNPNEHDKVLILVCRNCGDHMTFPVRELMKLPDREIWAPNLCPTCGNYKPEKAWNWITVASRGLSVRRSGSHQYAHGFMRICDVLRVNTVPRHRRTASS